jgi:hypothetical protein
VSRSLEKSPGYFRGTVYSAVLLTVIATLSCMSGKPSQLTESRAERPPITERLFGTWISSKPGYPMKIVMKADGRDELYVSILDPVPLYWSRYVVEEEWIDEKGIEWLALTYYCDEPFCENQQVESYAIATVSGDGTRLAIGWKADGMPDSKEATDYSQLFYREGTEIAKSVKDLASASAYVAIDRSESSYLIFYGIPDAEALDRIKTQTEPAVDVTFLSWEEFVPRSAEIVEAFVIHDDYEHPYLVPGIAALLRSYSDMPIGLTWNGGIAITATDFLYAEKYYQSYQDDPQEYDRNKIPNDITHHPMEHLRGLLGW